MYNFRLPIARKTTSSHFNSMIFRSSFSRLAIRIYSASALLTGLSTGNVQANTLPQLSANCFTYDPGHETGTEHHLTARNFKAELTGTGLSITVKNLSLTDQNQKLSPDALSRINAAAAYGILSTALYGISPNCNGQPLPEADEIKNSRPDAQWSNITLNHDKHAPLTLKNVHLLITSTTPTIQTIVTATGLHKADQTLLPDKVSADFSFQPTEKPPYQITLQDIKAYFGSSTIKGKGHILAASSIKESHASAHLSITEIGTLINEVNKTAPTKITTALLIARLMGHNEGHNVTGWDIQLQDAKVYINGITIPIGLH